MLGVTWHAVTPIIPLWALAGPVLTRGNDMDTQPDALASMQLPDQYRAPRSHLWEAKSSFEWYVRKHKPELIEEGALLLHAGRWHVRADRFDAYVLKAAERAAKAR